MSQAPNNHLTAASLELHCVSVESDASSGSDTIMTIDGIEFASCDDDDQLSVMSDSSYQRYTNILMYPMCEK